MTTLLDSGRSMGNPRREHDPSAGNPGKERLIDVYSSYFESVPANTDALRNTGYRLRYEVYCVEHPFEDPADSPDGLECDAFDEHSLHSLLMYRRSGTAAGAVRLILPRPGEDATKMPIHHVCRHELLLHDSDRLPRSRTAEISRFAVSKNFRRRTGDRETAVGGHAETEEDPRRLIPHISLGLMRAIVAMAAEAGMTHLCAVMEPALLRLLKRLGVHFNDLGPRVDYHGKRQPCFADLDELLARTWIERREVWEVLTHDGALWPINRALAGSLRSAGVMPQ